MTPDLTTQTDEPSRDRAILHLILAFTFAKLLFHLAINLWGGYEIFRDELYYLACADHLAWGYIDHPPLSVFLLAASRAVLGDSLFAIRLLPAIFGAGVVFLTGLLAREMGGGRWAVTLAATASMVAGSNLALASIWSMNVFDLFLTALAAYWLVRLIRTEEPTLWLALGGTFGLGLLNKVGMLWIGFGVFIGILLTRQRRWLATPWAWAGGAISVLCFLPYVVWNATNNWAHLEFIESAMSGKYSGLSAWTFLSGQILQQNPTTLLLWLAGLGWLLFAPSGRAFRPLGIAWITACAVLLLNGQSRAGYMAPTYAMLFAAGGVAWESLLRRRWMRTSAVAVVASGILLAPLATPMLPVESFIHYSQALGVDPGTEEGHELAELPQFYADMFGWKEKAAAVAEVYHRLPEADRQQATIFTTNYGRAGAIDYFAEAYDLPAATSGHNNYWLWGPGPGNGEVVIMLGGNREDLERRCESVEVAGTASCDYCIPYERDVPIHVCRNLRLSTAELWPLIKHYD